MGAARIFKDAVDGLVDRAAGVGLDLAARAMAAEVRRRLSVPGHGVPSAPGEPPRLQTGGLRESVSYTVDRRARRATVVVAHPAASYLEYGTRFLAPRPYIRPTLYWYRDTFGPTHIAAALHARHSPGLPIVV